MPQVTIKQVRPEDWNNELLHLQLDTLPGDEPLSPSQYGGLWWIAFDESTPVGFICLKDVGHSTIHLARAGVHSSYRGLRLYPRMVRAGLRYAKQLGFTISITDCTTWNYGSARGLMVVGYKPFWPAQPWGLPDSIYWTKDLNV